MEAQFPIFVADDPTADEIHANLCTSVRKDLRLCKYADLPALISWQKPGVVALFVANNQDAATATTIVQEASLRSSPVRIIFIQLNEDCEPTIELDNYLAYRGSWPNDLNSIADCLRTSPAVPSKKKPMSEAIADHLMVHTPSLVPQAARIAMAATHDVTVLLTGETGTGKTYLARMLHDHSPRSSHPFLMVPCGAQQSNLFESTFFGHVKGAYTGAHQTRVGRFAAAGRGSILLDEIDALGLEQQASLLRVIETGEYELVGGNETLRSEARIIVASNADLGEEVEKGNFRQDLYYRLNVISFHLPPLRCRRQDISHLARGIVARSNAKFRKGLFRISQAALDALVQYDWPGNIRQLENVLQEAVLTSTGPELMREDLPQLPTAEPRPVAEIDTLAIASPVLQSDHIHNGHMNGEVHSSQNGNTLVAGRFNYERGIIQKTLAGCKYNRSRAARVLGVSRVTLYKKMKQYGLTDLPSR